MDKDKGYKLELPFPASSVLHGSRGTLKNPHTHMCWKE